MSSIRSPITTRTRYNYTRSLTRIIFIARVNAKMAATRKAIEEFLPVSPQQRECGAFPMLTFLEIIHISLKEGWFICRGHECRCELFIYLHFPKIFTLGSVFSPEIFTLGSVSFLKNLYTWECIYINIQLKKNLKCSYMQYLLSL